MEENSHNPRGYYGTGIFEPNSSTTTGVVTRAAACFGAGYVVSVGKSYNGSKSDVGHYRHLPVFNFEDWGTMENSIPANSEIVLVDYDSSAYEVERFKHPERALYMVGNESHGFSEEILERNYRKCYIPSEFCLNAGVAAAMITRERYKDDRKI